MFTFRTLKSFLLYLTRQEHPRRNWTGGFEGFGADILRGVDIFDDTKPRIAVLSAHAF